ncbi:proline iminopeptidase [Ahrensia sp. R2A130]|nr:proline iminopeptidase [Ahrensia sp. R2A130]
MVLARGRNDSVCCRTGSAGRCRVIANWRLCGLPEGNPVTNTLPRVE